MTRTRAPRVVGTILKLFFVLVIMSVNALLLWRMCSSEDPSAIKILMVNDRTRAAYAENGDALLLQYQKQPSITREEKNYGYFSVTQCIFIPQANQVQIVVRYNNGTLKHLAEDYGLAEVPARDSTLFDVTLVMTTDQTPENREDNADPSKLEETRCYASEIRSEATTLYQYRRYIFDGISLTDQTVGVFADIYYLGDVDYSESAYGTLCLYDDESPWIPYRLTSADRRALAEEQ